MTTQSSVQNILLVDDRPENLVALEALLESPGRRLLKAGSGHDALAAALKHDLSLILLDVQMPDMDGFEVAELLRKNAKTRQVPVIFCTAISKEKKYISRGYDVGAADYLFKPIDPDLLTAKVRVFLELDQQKRKLQQTLLQLHRVQQENDRLLKALGEGVVGTDRNGLVTFANPAAAKLFGSEVTGLVGKRVDQLLFRDARGALLWSWEESPLVASVGRGDAWHSGGDLHHAGASGLLCLQVTATPINDRANAFSGAVLVVRDTGMSARMPASFQERRQFARKRLSAELTLFDRSTGATVGRLANLSEGGLRLVCKKTLAEGQRISFSMILPEMIRGSTTVSFDAVAVWAQPVSYGGDLSVGFRFVELKPEALDVIRVLLEKY